MTIFPHIFKLLNDFQPGIILPGGSRNVSPLPPIRIQIGIGNSTVIVRLLKPCKHDERMSEISQECGIFEIERPGIYEFTDIVCEKTSGASFVLEFALFSYDTRIGALKTSKFKTVTYLMPFNNLRSTNRIGDIIHKYNVVKNIPYIPDWNNCKVIHPKRKFGNNARVDGYECQNKKIEFVDNTVPCGNEKKFKYVFYTA